jgi:hypothetical protein
VRSQQLDLALTEFAQDAARYLQTDVECGSEVPFEVEQVASSRARTPLYCYRPLTSEFIGERWRGLSSLDSHARAIAALERFPGLDRYLGARETHALGERAHSKARRALWLLLGEVFAEQTDFEVCPERLELALDALARCATGGPQGCTIVATLHGMTICQAALPLAPGLQLAQPAALAEGAVEGAPGDLPPDVAPLGPTDRVDHLLVVLDGEHADLDAAVAAARSALRDLLTALRLFGDGRVTLGTLGWVRAAGGRWRAVALGEGGRPEGMLVVTEAQEDELRAFCDLVGRRRPEGNEVAWALTRFELGCARTRPELALSDYLLALRALLEPPGSAQGALAGRLATLCALPEDRRDLVVKVVRALELERGVIEGRAAPTSAARELVETVAGHLRALLRDVICGHLDADLAALADELIGREQPAEASIRITRAPEGRRAGAGAPAADEEAALVADDLEDQLRFVGMHG